MMNKPKEMAQAPPHWAIYFRVPDINAAAARIQRPAERSSTARWKSRAATGSSMRWIRRWDVRVHAKKAA